MFMELVASLTLWVSAQTGLPVADAPKFVFASPCEIQQITEPGIRCDNIFGAYVRAVYDDATETLYLAKEWDANSIVDQALLVHELTHHLQKRAGLEMNPEQKCKQHTDLEVPAYKTQRAYLAANGSYNEDNSVDTLIMYMSFACEPIPGQDF